MKYRVALLQLLLLVLCLIAVASVAGDAAAMPRGVKVTVAQPPKITPLMTKELTGIAGKEAVMLTVEYAPGASSSKHRHNAHTCVYVLEGSLVMGVAGGKEVTIGPG